jgi:predicted DCC family thiol-disulfide oxidoreductase YuxK
MEHLQVFYDGACPLCRAEMSAIAKMDFKQELALIDCAAPGFNRSAYEAQGITQAAMFEAMHVRSADGQWWSGPDAFARMYRIVGLNKHAAFWDMPFLRPFTTRLYPIIARNRSALSKCGFEHLFSWYTGRLADKAQARHAKSQAYCEANACQLPNSEK